MKSRQKLLLLTPPFTQINTPYPATSYLSGFLKTRGYDCAQADVSCLVFDRLFSRTGVQRIRKVVESAMKSKKVPRSDRIAFFLEAADDYERTIEPVISFLRGNDSSLCLRLTSRTFLPEGPRFESLGNIEDIDYAFGVMGLQDLAKHIASLYLDDLADVIREAVDPQFEFSKYGEKLAASQRSFDSLNNALKNDWTLIDDFILEITRDLLTEHTPNFIGLSVPFPGNMYGALRIGSIVKNLRPDTTVALGGGYINTELRQISDGRVFDFCDYILLDDGERPLECLLEHLDGKRPLDQLFRTFFRNSHGAVTYVNSLLEHDIPQRDVGTPTTKGLSLDKYISMVEMLNPLNRLWTDFRWNKLTLAHGCYWKKCSFCDTGLDYIGRYEPNRVDAIILRMKAMIAETGTRGFHFVDEAAPPALLEALSDRILEEKLAVTWWSNIRFERTFTPELALKMSDAGCVAVTGGLEVASDRLLRLMQKGVTVDQVAHVTRAFVDAGIFVHAYLMFGFPTQTIQETIDSLEVVRQLFREGCLHSGFWHRFTATIHSPVGKAPEKYGIRLLPISKAENSKHGVFAVNDLGFEDPIGTPHDLLGNGLRKALYNYMLGIGTEDDVSTWFSADFSSAGLGLVPRTSHPQDLIRKILNGPKPRGLRLVKSAQTGPEAEV